MTDNQTNKTLESKNLPGRRGFLALRSNCLLNRSTLSAETLPLAMVAVQRVVRESTEQLGKFLRDECAVVKIDGDTTTYGFEGSQYLKHQRFVRRIQKAELALTLVPRSQLVGLVSQFDAYMGGLIRQIFKARPEILDSSEKQLTLSQLVECGTVDAVRELVVDKEVESVLRESHSDQFNWLENKLKLPLRKDLAIWPAFIELTERRNLFVHTDGIVSRQYLEVCRRNSCQIPPDLEVGDTLPLNREYFASAAETVLEIGIKLGQVLWRKLCPNEIEAADENLVVATYTIIAEGRYRLACPLLDFRD